MNALRSLRDLDALDLYAVVAITLVLACVIVWAPVWRGWLS